MRNISLLWCSSHRGKRKNASMGMTTRTIGLMSRDNAIRWLFLCSVMSVYEIKRFMLSKVRNNPWKCYLTYLSFVPLPDSGEMSQILDRLLFSQHRNIIIKTCGYGGVREKEREIMLACFLSLSVFFRFVDFVRPSGDWRFPFPSLWSAKGSLSFTVRDLTDTSGHLARFHFIRENWCQVLQFANQSSSSVVWWMVKHKLCLLMLCSTCCGVFS